jgi:MFS family permease
MTTDPDNSWRALIAHGGMALPVFIGGVGLQAIEAFIGASMLPTVVHDIGGLDLFAWNTTLFIVASILATVFAATRPAAIGPRGAYFIAAAGFGLGSLICGLAPSMIVLLVGRFVQGFGAGLLVSTTLAMIRLVFPQPLWPRAMALNAMVWGVATLLGPAIGGVFAQFDMWRWAFLAIVPLAALLGLGAVTVLPRREASQRSAGAPVLQIALVVAAILLVSIASLLTQNPVLAALLLGCTALDIVLLAAVEARAANRLLPAGALAPSTALGTLFVTILLFGISITSDIFAPLFLQQLHGVSPLWAGYLTALAAAGWTVAAIVSSGFHGARIRAAIVAGPLLMLLATIGLAVFLADARSGVLGLVLSGVSLFVLGSGIGIAFQHLSTGVLASGDAADNDRVSAALGMVQLFASGAGAAIGGVVVNAAGLPQATDTAGLEHAAHWLYWAFAALTALIIPLALRAIGTTPRLAPQPAE